MAKKGEIFILNCRDGFLCFFFVLFGGLCPWAWLSPNNNHCFSMVFGDFFLENGIEGSLNIHL